MAQVCAICLERVVPVSTCQSNGKHTLHTACALDMQRLMGRDTCPLCTEPITLPSPPAPPFLCIVEHSVHAAIAFSWLFLLTLIPDTSAFKQDTWAQVKRTRAAIRSRTSLLGDNKASEVVLIRSWTIQILTMWAVFIYSAYLLAKWRVFTQLWDMHVVFFTTLQETVLFVTNEPCSPSHQRCMLALTPIEVWARTTASWSFW